MLSRLMAKPSEQPSYEDQFQKFLAWQEEAKQMSTEELQSWIEANRESGNEKLPAYKCVLNGRTPQPLPTDTERYLR